MATLQEIAQMRRRLPSTQPGNTFQGLTADYSTPSIKAGTPITSDMLSDLSPFLSHNSSAVATAPPPVPGTIGPGNFMPNVSAPGSLAGPLATDASVNAAYNALMAMMATRDSNKGIYQRNLTTGIEDAQKNRVKSELQARQAMSDRGMLNSGAALTSQTDIGTAFDAYTQNLNNQYTDQLSAMDRNLLGLTDVYKNTQDTASARWTADQAQAASDALAAQSAAALQQQQMADLIAAMTPPTTTPTIYEPAPTGGYNPYIAPKPKPAPKPASGTTGKLKLSPIGGGPQ